VPVDRFANPSRTCRRRCGTWPTLPACILDSRDARSNICARHRLRAKFVTNSAHGQRTSDTFAVGPRNGQATRQAQAIALEQELRKSSSATPTAAGVQQPTTHTGVALGCNFWGGGSV
jgi:hypothetical protein